MRVLKAKAVPGFLPGIPQPSLVLDLAVPRMVDAARLARSERAMGLEPADLERLPAELLTRASPLVLRFMAAVTRQLREAGFPVFTPGAVMGTNPSTGHIRLALPSNWHGPQATAAAVKVVANLLSQPPSRAPGKPAMQGPEHLAALARRQAPKGMNSLRFLDAAHELGIPVQHVAGNVYQFGWGRQARWLDSSFTDETAQISSTLARDKFSCAQALRRAGVPVPEHALAWSADEAVAIARELGFPVVVKPADLDGGHGVAAGLRHEQAVRMAFEKARTLSGQILVEKHFEGNDYRVHVFRDQAYWVAHRQPGGVTGDGIHNVAQLLATTNSDPRRGPAGSKALLKHIEMDEEAQDLLQEQSLTLEDIPAAGKFVRLRRAANIASGGVPVPMLEEAHPDNLALAVRAARALRLDLAGIDLLIPDIRTSWRESGAAICEVNAKPQLSPTLHSYLLKRLVRGQGRIPAFMVLGDLSQAAWLAAFQESVRSSGRCLGLATPDAVSVGMETIMQKGTGAWQAGIAVLADPRTEAFMLCTNSPLMGDTGFPVDRIDSLVLLDPPQGMEANPQWRAMCLMAMRMCSGLLLATPACRTWLGKLPGSLSTRIQPLEPARAAQALMDNFETLAP